MKLLCVLAVSTGIVLSGCTTTPPLRDNEHLTVSPTGVLPPPTPADLTLSGRPYIIGPLDRIAVEVFGVDTLTRTIQADSTGRISFPLAGEIEAAGLTPAQLGQELQRRLASYVRNPRVLVNIAEAVSQVITIDGEVQEPGLYPVVGRMTLMRAVARAKGATEFARLTHVVVFRTVGGRQMAALYDLRAIRAGIYEDPQVYSQDVVVVGENQARRIFHDVVQGSALITAPIIALLSRN
jgi:polysaccharide export outer membrane protein